MEDPPDVATLISGLVSDNEGARKYAVFRLQSLLADPSFADAFIQADGLYPLRHTVLETSGNTQAYALGSLDALLELDSGWEAVDEAIIEKVSYGTIQRLGIGIANMTTGSVTGSVPSPG